MFTIFNSFQTWRGGEGLYAFFPKLVFSFKKLSIHLSRSLIFASKLPKLNLIYHSNSLRDCKYCAISLTPLTKGMSELLC